MEYSQKDVIVGEQWLILSKIGEGSFGEVFKAQDIATKGLFAVKRESQDVLHPQLHHESIIYDILAGGPCIPKCHWYGQYDGFDCIVIDLLGSSIKELQQTVRDIPLDIVIDLGCQLISCLEHIHDRGLVYRDIKPENFLFSASCVIQEEPNFFKNNNNNNNNNSYNSPPPSPPSSSCRNIPSNTCLFAIDFGLVTWWRNPKTKKPFSECKKPIKFKTGTARYASLNVHRGRTHARRDDMESLGYMLLDLLLGGELPWSGVTARSSKAGWDRIKTIKEEILLQDMCLGLPFGIMNFIDYTRRLRFNDRPDYDYLRTLLRGCNDTSTPYSKLVTPPHSHTRLIPSPPKYSYNNNSVKRRNSTTMYKFKSEQYKQQSYEDVFVMDDLVKELPTTTTPPPPTNTNTTTRKSNNSFYRNNNHYRHHSLSNSSQHRQYNYSQKRYQPQSNNNWTTFANNHLDQWEYPNKALQTP